MRKIISGVLSLVFLISGSSVLAAPDNPAPAGILQLQQIIRRLINLSVEAAFIVLTIMLVVGGIKYLTSGGEPKSIGSAGGTITWALLGVLFLALAWIILRLLEALTGVTLTQFCIGFPGADTACPL